MAQGPAGPPHRLAAHLAICRGIARLALALARASPLWPRAWPAKPRNPWLSRGGELASTTVLLPSSSGARGLPDSYSETPALLHPG
ncbi:hypothetical protein J1614_009651 [Plenodomus biglobosus]|nr:hypothetical protein J1614_009651 [Plenodomus biglobosus]